MDCDHVGHSPRCCLLSDSYCRCVIKKKTRRELFIVSGELEEGQGKGTKSQLPCAVENNFLRIGSGIMRNWNLNPLRNVSRYDGPSMEPPPEKSENTPQYRSSLLTDRSSFNDPAVVARVIIVHAHAVRLRSCGTSCPRTSPRRGGRQAEAAASVSISAPPHLSAGPNNKSFPVDPPRRAVTNRLKTRNPDPSHDGLVATTLLRRADLSRSGRRRKTRSKNSVFQV